MDVMLTTITQIQSPASAATSARHEFAYPRVEQISPRAHTVLASTLNPRQSASGGSR